MNTIYWLMPGILLLLAVFDLVVGVSNDAANFLNAAMGCRAAKRRTILAFAACGVLPGAAFSGGMMEIARNGVFEPSLFRYHDIMILFLAVMLTDVLLLDMFNTLGLPTSTTVSLVFELLGAGLAVAVAAIASGTGLSDTLSDYIHEGKAFGIISGIFCSVAVAFVCGTVVMWFSRLLFSFRHGRSYRHLSALWAAVSMTCITWFAVFKGLKHSVLVQTETLTAGLGSHARHSLQEQAQEPDALFSAALMRHLMHHAESESDLRRALLFLTLLNETRGMVAQAFHLADALPAEAFTPAKD